MLHKSMAEDKPFFDESAYRALAGMAGPERMATWLGKLVAQIDLLLAAVPEQAHAVAHKLVAQAGMLGFSHFSDLCWAYEEAVLAGDGSALFETLHRAAAEVRNAAERHRTNPELL